VRFSLTFATAQLLRVLPREEITRFAGRLADVRWSPKLERAVLGAYCKAYAVNLGECEQSDGFRNFDAFFTRSLRPGARPVDPAAGTLVSPADGRIDAFGPIDESSTFFVKGTAYRTQDLIGDEDEARAYVGGLGCVVYLSPRDYHRVHTPVSGTMSLVRSLPGDYFPVNSIGLEHIESLFVRNRRVAIAIDNPVFGRVYVVMVSAMIVGRITVAGIDARDVPYGDHATSLSLQKGDEIGKFHLGSTAVVLIPPKAAPAFCRGAGPSRMGEPLAKGEVSA